MERGADSYTCIDVTGIEYSLSRVSFTHFIFSFFPYFFRGVLDAREMNKEG